MPRISTRGFGKAALAMAIHAVSVLEILIALPIESVHTVTIYF
jgi:hypothetical protein